MKAQISLELLIVFAVFLTVIVFSLYTLNMINKRNVDAYRSMKMRMAFEDIADSTDNVCVLGNGNVRKIYIPFEINIDYNGSHIFVSGHGKEYSKYVPCKITNTPVTVNKTILIKNINGDIEIW